MTIDERMRQAFKYVNRFMLLLWRLGLGRAVNGWPAVGGRIMVLTTVGRKSGCPRRTPLNYALVDGELYCTAGFGGASDWYRNILAQPAVDVWLPDGWWAGTAEDITDDVALLPLLRQVLIGSGIVAALVGVNPRTLSDDELAAETAGYRLIHIRRTTARTGAGGPGELAWVWPLAGLIALFTIERRIRRRFGNRSGR